MKARPYQQTAIDAAVEKALSAKAALIVMATGLGKTVVFAHVAGRLADRGRVLVVAHRQELVYQAADKVSRVTGEYPEVEMAGEWADRPTLHGRPSRYVVASLQTLVSGLGGRGRLTRFHPWDFSLLVID